MPKFYWYKRGGFTLAVDAINRQDAAQYLKAWHHDETENNRKDGLWN